MGADKVTKRIARRILLTPVVRRSLSKVVDFYNNLPVDSLQEEFELDGDKSQSPLFHVGSVMPFPDKDAAALKKVVGMALKDNMLVAEVGSWTGKSTGVIAKNVLSRHGHVYAIDHWQGSIDVWQYDVAKKYNIFSVFRKNMELLGVSDAVHPLVMDSQTASKIFKDGSLDLVFIDGDHRYTPVKNDILLWVPKLKRGGILCGHDCSGYYSKFPKDVQELIDKNCEQDDIPGVGHPGVIKALYDCFHDKHLIMPDSVVWYYKE